MQQYLSEHRVGDKVRLKSGPSNGTRGLIKSINIRSLNIILNDGKEVEAASDEVTNFSLAARRAWKVMPKRAGRPKLPSPTKRMVSLRLDVDLWKALARMVELGLVPSKEEAVNVWLREKLVHLIETSPLSDKELLENFLKSEETSG